MPQTHENPYNADSTVADLFEDWKNAKYQHQDTWKQTFAIAEFCRRLRSCQTADEGRKLITETQDIDIDFVSTVLRTLLRSHLTATEIAMMHEATDILSNNKTRLSPSAPDSERWPNSVETLRQEFRETLKARALDSQENFQAFLHVRQNMPHHDDNNDYAIIGTFHVKDVLETLQKIVDRDGRYPNDMTHDTVSVAVQFVNTQAGKLGASSGQSGAFKLQQIDFLPPFDQASDAKIIATRWEKRKEQRKHCLFLLVQCAQNILGQFDILKSGNDLAKAKKALLDLLRCCVNKNDGIALYESLAHALMTIDSLSHQLVIHETCAFDDSIASEKTKEHCSILRRQLKDKSLNSDDHLNAFLTLRENVPNEGCHEYKQGAFHVRDVLKNLQKYISRHKRYPNDITNKQVQRAVQFINNQARLNARANARGTGKLKVITITDPAIAATATKPPRRQRAPTTIAPHASLHTPAAATAEAFTAPGMYIGDNDL